MVNLLLSLVASLIVTADAAPAPSAPVFQGTFNGELYKYNELAGYGFVPSDARDKFGDTLGGIVCNCGKQLASTRKSYFSFSVL
jgi:hypothetical protein